ncbi:hypothetical protein BGLA2_420116 [Burkholderia gladioli]|nr:hypothetical protein BGLA2_420116 [Burkholderia gladioli]
MPNKMLKHPPTTANNIFISKIIQLRVPTATLLITPHNNILRRCIHTLNDGRSRY